MIYRFKEWLKRLKNNSEQEFTENGESIMTPTWRFKDPGDAARFAGLCLNTGAGCVLIQTIKQTNQEGYFVVHVTESSDGITPPNGCGKPQTTSTAPRSYSEESGYPGYLRP
jgi:hypothetical protein